MAAESRIVGYKKIFGFVLPDWVNESMIRNFGLSMLGVAAMMIVLIFFIWPNYDTIKTRENDLKANQESLKTLQESKSGLDRLQSDLSSADQTRILTAMPQNYSPDLAIFALRRISADTGVSIISYSLPSGVLLDTATQTTGGSAGGAEMVSFVTVPIQISVAAPVEALVKFISEVESSLPFGVVSDLSLQEVTKLARTSSDKTVSLALEIHYFQALLKNVNLNKLQAFTPEELQVAKDLSKYNLLSVPDTTTAQTNVPIATGSGNLFGF